MIRESGDVAPEGDLIETVPHSKTGKVYARICQGRAAGYREELPWLWQEGERHQAAIVSFERRDRIVESLELLAL